MLINDYLNVEPHQNELFVLINIKKNIED